MKKIYLTLALVFAIGCNVFAQRCDLFFDYKDIPSNRLDETEDIGLCLPSGGLNSTDNESGAPLGSGLLILAALGAGYAFRKKE